MLSPNQRLLFLAILNHMARDGGPSAWDFRLPHPMLTLDRLETFDTLSGVRQVQTFKYHNGFYDGVEKQFRGFRDVEMLTEGDPSMEGGRTVHTFEVGQYDPYRKGLLIQTVAETDGRVLSETTTTYVDCPLASLVPERLGLEDSSSTEPIPVRFICNSSSENLIKEGKPENEWVKTATATEYDSYGNVMLSAKYGIVERAGKGCGPCEFDPTKTHGWPCGDQCLGDEMFEEVQYVPPTATGGKWILRAPYHKRVYGVPGGMATEELTYYDGDDFVGLALGNLTKGLVKRQTKKISEDSDATINAQRLSHDLHGNVLEIMDANGHKRRLEYDSRSLLPTAEVVVFDDPNRAEPYELRLEIKNHSLFDHSVILRLPSYPEAAWWKSEVSCFLPPR